MESVDPSVFDDDVNFRLYSNRAKLYAELSAPIEQVKKWNSLNAWMMKCLCLKWNCVHKQIWDVVIRRRIYSRNRKRVLLQLMKCMWNGILQIHLKLQACCSIRGVRIDPEKVEITWTFFNSWCLCSISWKWWNKTSCWILSVFG